MVRGKPAHGTIFFGSLWNGYAHFLMADFPSAGWKMVGCGNHMELYSHSGCDSDLQFGDLAGIGGMSPGMVPVFCAG